MFALYDEGACAYVCKGGYVFRGEKYKVMGDQENAKKYKTKQAAENDKTRMIESQYVNIDYKTIAVEVEE